MKETTLTQHAARRSRLAGQAILDDGNPWFVPLDTLQSDVAKRGGSLVSFANYDYLGLADHPAVQRAASEALERYGVGALGSRLVGGQRSCHSDFEAAVAAFVGSEACLSLVSGYLTNLSIISHLMGIKDLIIYDEYCHNSIVAGVKNSKALALECRHNDVDHIEEIILEQRASKRNCLIVIEGIYSMDGDIPHLPSILRLKEKYNCWLLVDEAHSFGVLGKTGRGISEYFNEESSGIDLIIGTLSKTLASCGGFICARQPVIDWLRFTLPGFVYSVGLSPVIISAAHAALNVMIEEPERTAKLARLSEQFLHRARETGLDVGASVGRGIVPVLFDDLATTMAASQKLLAANIYAPPIVHVGVPKDAPRIRFFLSAKHEFSDVEAAIGVLQGTRPLQEAELASVPA